MPPIVSAAGAGSPQDEVSPLLALLKPTCPIPPAGESVPLMDASNLMFLAVSSLGGTGWTMTGQHQHPPRPFLSLFMEPLS